MSGIYYFVVLDKSVGKVPINIDENECCKDVWVSKILDGSALCSRIFE